VAKKGNNNTWTYNDYKEFNSAFSGELQNGADITPAHVDQLVRGMREDLKGRELQADLFPDQTEEALLSYLTKAQERSRRLHTGVRELLGAGLGDRTAAFLEHAGALSGKDAFPAGPAAALLKRYRFQINGTDGFQRCQACAGGIPTDEVKPESMESRIVPGLYAAGELLDVLGECGGYNLHFAFLSGTIAGRNAAVYS